MREGSSKIGDLLENVGISPQNYWHYSFYYRENVMTDLGILKDIRN